MLKDSIKELFERDLLKLKEEISLYKDDVLIWKLKPGINNTAGNLCLHLIGNLNHFIGAMLGNTGFIRERDKEFSSKDIPKSKMISEIEKTISMVNVSISGLSEEDLNKIFPLEMFGKQVSTSWMLLNLLTHLNYHLGQINYHRRLVL